MYPFAARLIGAALAGLAISMPIRAADSPSPGAQRPPAMRSEKAGEYVEDSVITAKVKAALLQAPELSSRDVDVETDHGRVLLTGTVRSKAERDQAIKTAAAVQGVMGVKDALVVR